jgi:hypothetical protein
MAGNSRWQIKERYAKKEIENPALTAVLVLSMAAIPSTIPSNYCLSIL